MENEGEESDKEESDKEEGDGKGIFTSYFRFVEERERPHKKHR